jgi:hypothetical protein
MRAKFGDESVVNQARQAEETASSWLDRVSSGSKFPFLRVKTLMQSS